MIEFKELDSLAVSFYRHWQQFFCESESVLLQVLFGDVWVGRDGKREGSTPAHFENFERFWTTIEDAGGKQGEILRGHDTFSLESAVISARLFLTTTGRLGNAKTGIQAGDLVA